MIAALGAAACGGGGSSADCSPRGTASVVVGGGTAQTGFLALADGDPMPVVLGPQGLYMVTPSVRVQGLYPGVSGRTGDGSDPEITIELYLGSELIGGAAHAHLGLTHTAAGDERLGIFSPFTVPATDRARYTNHVIRVHAVVADACGRSATDDLNALAQP